MRPWTLVEVKVLRAYSGLGKAGVAALLGRSVDSVKWAARTHGVSLEVVDDDIDIAVEVLDVLERIREAPGLEVCPMCGRRFARTATGLCRSCHLDQLLELHQERLDEEVRLRRLDKARQDRRRLRVCRSCGADFYPRPTSTDVLCKECSR